MTDKELLELAATALGHPRMRIPDDGVFVLAGREWNPLDDDGDALRLAVNLGMTIDVMPNSDLRKARTVVTRGEGAQEFHIADPYAATRRAIVRAAAKIGKEAS